MSIREKSIALLAIICFFASTTSANERIAYQKHWDFPYGSKIFFNPKLYRQSDEYQNLTYLLCNFHDEKFERNCTAAQDTQPERSCSVTLEHINTDDDLEIYPFGSTRAVIFWSKQVTKGLPIKCIILDFGTCKSKYVLLKESLFSIRWAYFAAYEDSFDLIVSNSFNVRNKYHIDVEGKVTFSQWTNHELSRLGFGDEDYRAIVADSKLQAFLNFGYSLSIFDRYSIVTSLIKPDGWSKVLAVYHDQIGYFQKVESTAHEKIGVAVVYNHRVNVSQFDQEGELKLNTSLTYTFHVRYLALRNLADGGFLLFTIGYGGSEYHLTKVDDQGKVLGTIQMEPERNCGGETPSLQVFDNEANEYCFVVACCDNVYAKLDLVVRCVSDEDLCKSEFVF
ncbi:uncharacterized protein LOC100122981 [Nasonia vitripennis]|uniref:Uncharacterized protein n=1 Tax=Nasonia vitripennis TaxID=7425 RepID=A0A7M7G6Y6_NASVI|nr:uncharacterized protein LOC100122981 [Nasonia vitripennis]